MGLVEQWNEIERGLPEDWADARLSLTVHDEAQVAGAAALLGPLNPGRSGKTIRFFTARRGAGFGPDHIRKLLRKIDRQAIRGRLELVSSSSPQPVADVVAPSLAATWDRLVAELPADWSDVYAELELTSTDHLERAALLLAPVNPARYGGKPGFRFRVARLFGYGASPQMTRRSLERLDKETIPGVLAILRVLSDTQPVATQGPVWYVGGRAV